MSAPKSAPSPATVLIAEDEPLLLAIMVETMEDAGYVVLPACDGAVALDILKAAPHVDLLISDVRMPYLTGYQLTEEGLKLCPAMKVLLVTGYASDPVPGSIRGSVAAVMQKPLNLDNLPRIAETIINRPDR